MTEAAQAVRVDKWLWAVRLYKTRTLATDACKAGHVSIGGANIKPSRELRIGEIVTVRTSELTKTVKVLASLEQRVGPKLISNYLEDITPAAEYLRVIQARQQQLTPFRPKGAGRPTKKERRELEQLL